MSLRDNVFADIAAERERQELKWGEQNHPDVSPPPPLPFSYATKREYYEDQAALWKRLNSYRVEENRVAWDGILLEEVYEACAEEDPVRLREELIQVAAVAANWAECLDRRSGGAS